MPIIKINKTNLKESINIAIEILNRGGIIAYPTETFYGLGVKYDLENSLKKLIKLKKRPSEKGIPLIIGNKNQLSLIAEHVNKTAEKLMEKFWQGPLTLLLQAKKSLSSVITAGTNKVAVRIPGESFALLLAKQIDFPITSTSANPSNLPPAKNAEMVLKYFNDEIDMIFDYGCSTEILPSTIVDTANDKIRVIREGLIKKNQIAF